MLGLKLLLTSSVVFCSIDVLRTLPDLHLENRICFVNLSVEALLRLQTNSDVA
jgi:hypothetical protein